MLPPPMSTASVGNSTSCALDNTESAARWNRHDALRKARVCYNHLAGDLGVTVYDGMIVRGYLAESDDDVSLTRDGEQFVDAFGIDLPSLAKSRRPMCKSCLDWSSRRTHLAGSLGSAMLDRFYRLGWAARVDGSRVVEFSADGERKMLKSFGVKAPAS